MMPNRNGVIRPNEPVIPIILAFPQGIVVRIKSPPDIVWDAIRNDGIAETH